MQFDPLKRFLPSQNNLARRTALVSLALSTLLLSACSKYQLTLNDNVMYSPPGLFTKFTTASMALRNCLDQTISDGRITDPAQLTRLICTHAGVDSLAGLEVFTHLKELDIGDNRIRELAPLKFLTRLETLIINNNELQSAAELLTLPKLKQINLAGNTQLDCKDLQQLQNQSTLELVLPKQCETKG